MTDASPRDRADGSPPPLADERSRLTTDARGERDTLARTRRVTTDWSGFADADGNLTLVNPGGLAGVRRPGRRTRGGDRGGASRSTGPTGRRARRWRHRPCAPSGGETIRNEEEIVRTPVTGELRHRLVSGVPVRDGEGAVIGSVCVVRDITGRRRTEEALRQSREDLDRAAAVGQIGWWRLDTRANVLTWSDENYRIFGVPKGTPLTYETFLAISHPDDREYVDAQWQAGMRGEPYDIEHRIVADGKVKWVREKAYLEYDGEGRLLGGFGITQDITERREAEEALRESEAERTAQQERARLARDLHDSVSQAIFAATLKAEALEMAAECGDDGTGPAARQVCRLCRGALADLRAMLLELRGESLEDIPLEQLLRQLVEAAEGRTSAGVELAIRGIVRATARRARRLLPRGPGGAEQRRAPRQSAARPGRGGPLGRRRQPRGAGRRSRLRAAGLRAGAPRHPFDAGARGGGGGRPRR